MRSIVHTLISLGWTFNLAGIGSLCRISDLLSQPIPQTLTHTTLTPIRAHKANTLRSVAVILCDRANINISQPAAANFLRMRK